MRNEATGEQEPLNINSEIDSTEATIMEVSAQYCLRDSVTTLGSGEAKLKLTTTSFSIMPSSGRTVRYSFQQVTSFKKGDYRVLIEVLGETIEIFNLGYNFEDFLATFAKIRNEILLKELLMNETFKHSGSKAQFQLVNEAGTIISQGESEPRVYETGLVIMAFTGDLFRIPYSLIQQIDAIDYQIIITTDDGEKLILKQLGREYDPFVKALSDTINELNLKVQLNLTELFPGFDSRIINRLSQLIKDGKAAVKPEIEAVDPGLWTAMEEKIAASSLSEEYMYLKGLSVSKNIAIGIKRGLMGDLTGEYIWFLIPIYSNNRLGPGNAIAMEAISADGSGKATYLFRFLADEDYRSASLEGLDEASRKYIKQFNRAMLEINFRREPIYLSESKLSESHNLKYRMAIAQLPSLKFLRSTFIGRVIHKSQPQWEQEILDLLNSNTVAGERLMNRKGG